MLDFFFFLWDKIFFAVVAVKKSKTDVCCLYFITIVNFLSYNMTCYNVTRKTAGYPHNR